MIPSTAAVYAVGMAALASRPTFGGETYEGEGAGGEWCVGVVEGGVTGFVYEVEGLCA